MSFYEGLHEELKAKRRNPLAVRIVLALMGFADRVQRLFRRRR